MAARVRVRADSVYTDSGGQRKRRHLAGVTAPRSPARRRSGAKAPPEQLGSGSEAAPEVHRGSTVATPEQGRSRDRHETAKYTGRHRQPTVLTINRPLR